MGDTGWRSRGYLPHFDQPELVQLITFRLHDSLPKHALLDIETKIENLDRDREKAEQRRKLERWLDAGAGGCHLSQPEISRIVEDRLLASDGEECLLLAWTIMPNHVHVLCELADEVPRGRLLNAWKGSTARAANLRLGKSGKFWAREYHDRFIRNTEHLQNATAYIDHNPVKARLCRTPSDWMFGSARHFGGPSSRPLKAAVPGTSQ